MVTAERMSGWLRELRQREDFLPGAIALAAIFLFTVTATQMSAVAIAQLGGSVREMEEAQTASVLLNVALILFAWRRHRDARAAMEQRLLAERRAQLLRSRDLATELLNRQSLKELGNAIIAKADESGDSVALAIVNLIAFKKVNEVHGDAVGDAVLRTVASVILASAPKAAVCARLGADEFAVAVSYRAEEEHQIVAFAQHLATALGGDVPVEGKLIPLAAAIGVSRLEIDCVNFSALLRRADLAMRAAKAEGGKRPIWFEARMERAVRARHDLEAGLRRGIPAGEFVPYYQPLVELATGKIHSFEMLARWHHPSAGIVTPEVFIPVAEELGLICDLSCTLLRVACRDASQWDPALSLCVNISPRQLADPLLAQKLLNIFAEEDFPPERVELEITESSLFQDLEQAQAAVATLKRHGIRIALDDFGTGYSSLAHLRALPFDRIKIDRSFILSLNKDPESWTIVRTILTMGEAMGVPVTAEGVESAAIELRLRQLSCDLGQGWFFGRPLPAAETAALLGSAGLLAAASPPPRRRLAS